MSEPTPTSRRESDREIELAASRWIARRDAGMSATEQREFAAWRGADVRHERALARHEATWRWFDRPAGAGQADELVAALARSRVQRRRRQRAVLVASFVLVLALGAVWQRGRVADRAQPVGDLRPGGTVVVLPQTQSLPDGSSVELKPGAEFVVAYTPELRRIQLRRGEALFHVVKDSNRPFVVAAAGVAVRAVGTAFSVAVEQDQVDVLVTQGRVAVESAVRPAETTPAAESRDAGAPVRAANSPEVDAAAVIARPEIKLQLGAGQRTLVLPAAVDEPHVETLSPTEQAARLAWRSPRLEFTATPLQEAIDLFNRYAMDTETPRLVIDPADASLAQLEVSGYFRANNTAAFLHLISQTLGIAAETKSDRIILRRAR